MDEWIARLKSKTLEIIKRQDEIPYEEILELVKLRLQLLEELQRAELPEAEQLRYREELGAFLLEYDEQVVQIAQRLKDEASKQLRKISSGHSLKHRYEAGYDRGSLFFDRKK